MSTSEFFRWDGVRFSECICYTSAVSARGVLDFLNFVGKKKSDFFSVLSHPPLLLLEPHRRVQYSYQFTMYNPSLSTYSQSHVVSQNNTIFQVLSTDFRLLII